MRDWLEQLRAELVGAGHIIPRPEPKPEEPSEALGEHQQRIQELYERLAGEIPVEQSERTEEEQGRWLLANMLDWHRREQKASWWEYFDPFLDRVIVHLRDGYTVPDRPSWFGDIEPILAQFGRLYPIMTKHLVDLTDYTSVAHHRRALLLAFTRPLADSNYMPVTRDLSAQKQATLVKWLQTETGDPDEPLVKGTPSAPVAAAAPAVREAGAIPPDSGKPAFERLDAFRRGRRAPGSLPTI